jgi:hypothetical protein
MKEMGKDPEPQSEYAGPDTPADDIEEKER